MCVVGCDYCSRKDHGGPAGGDHHLVGPLTDEFGSDDLVRLEFLVDSSAHDERFATQVALDETWVACSLPPADLTVRRSLLYRNRKPHNRSVANLHPLGCLTRV
ncbi:hypothetical protein FRACA_370039 [Frankia canadensis]|uniref:Uncharacterized protein n=1 Tax=Frankia canadensis TaxID=1836972 RepID=A0A2I2KVT3_9ACTN|nr:hypothetical protein [Frankia canadensis]SNQ49762.1 hypothetical protein FRACA_370039 [Frankia canadensis]SOU57052.1 hypothetical protein FRACA_370039 [Frankia canadensis]